MLFDLRGRGRRRTVQVIYIGLAALIGIGLVGFGIGGGFGSGGLLNAANNNEGSSGAGYAGEIKKYQKVVARQPNNVAAWEALIKAQLHQAGNEAYVTHTGEVTSKGRALYSEIAQSWRRYLALNPRHPNLELTKQMLTVYSEEGLNQPTAAVEAAQIAVAAEPSNPFYFRALAEYAYKAHNLGVGDLAAARAISMAPAEQRARLRTVLAEVKKQASGKSSTPTSTSATTPTSTTTKK
jgi:tetratricopeptide (TPR) repeat protein